MMPNIERTTTTIFHQALPESKRILSNSPDKVNETLFTKFNKDIKTTKHISISSKLGGRKNQKESISKLNATQHKS